MEDAHSLALRQGRDKTLRATEKSDARDHATDARQSTARTRRSPYHSPGSLSGRTTEGRILVDTARP